VADATVLVVAHQYNAFVKAQVDELADFVNEVHVYVRYNRFGDLGRYVDVDALQGHGRADKVADESPPNVHVTPTPLTYLPVAPWYRYLGHHHYLAVRRRLAASEASFDLIHGHFTWTAGYVAARLGDRLGVPTVLTVHENRDWLDRELAWEHEPLEWALRNQDALVRVNERDCQRLAAYNDAVYAVPNGFDRGRFPVQPTAAARRALDLPTDADVVFSVGDLSPRKRFDRLIDAVARLDRDGRLICAVAGHGRERADLERQAARIGRAADRGDGSGLEVRVLGFIPNAELARWMNACDVFALASEAEGNPTVMFEALGCGKPYVGTNVGGVDEVIESDEYGLYCPPDSMDGLVDVLESGLDREWDREAILDHAEQFTWERIVRRLAGLYRTVLQESESPGGRRRDAG
jgi:glycosyltransferase involved in cell wall biosynthesis